MEEKREGGLEIEGVRQNMRVLQERERERKVKGDRKRK